MTALSETVREMSGYKLHLVKTDKYKTNTLVWKMKAPLQASDVTKRAILPYVLQSSTKKYPSTAKLRSYLDELYGATLYVDLAKKGEYHIITVSIEIANEKFLGDQTPLLKNAFELLSEILLNPNASNHSFDAATVEMEKRTLKQRIQSVYDDKMRYSNLRLIQEMCLGEPYALSVNGELEHVNQINAENLFQYYQQALSEDELDLYIIGDIDEEEVYNTASKLINFHDRTPKEAEKISVQKKEKVSEVIEKQDVKQGKLNIGYRTNVVYGDPDYYALQLFNGIFGGFSHSKLFRNVREKASLAYYAASRLESHKGLLMVMSGIDAKNYQQAVQIINEQMHAMKNGDFTDEEINQTKAVIRNQLLETIDTSRGIVEVLYHNIVSKQPIDFQTWLKGMEQVTREDIMKVAQKIEADTIYFLTGMEGGSQ
ncbi:peptidase M16 domain protein [Bacillus methanolicus PB1]|uniref:Peptidase M16 domain protein n=1 Tax=Bacillus methanolicus PB1 TaxID=997296 RepID=I3E4L0_BACMT|nr:pitrilysin family protein [Bacillus methanolicus]EIJ81431.1 peptidase M16 domain protein [Bacillus methanolicus PB1]